MPKVNRKRKHDSKKDDNAPKSKQKLSKDVQEGEHLSKILFGGASSFLKSLEEAEQETPSGDGHTTDSGVGEEDSDEVEENVQKVAWVDEDDDGIDVGHALKVQGRRLPKGGINDPLNHYSLLLKHKFTSALGTPQWASLKKKREYNSDSDDEIFQSCGFVKNVAQQNLPQSTLEFKKVNDLNSETHNEGIINCVDFHPTSSAALVAGNTGVLSLLAVDGKRNNKLHSVSFQRFPILCAKFLNSGNEVILGSRKSHIFSYDLTTTRSVRIPLPHGLAQCKNFTLSPDSKYIAVAGKWGEVHVLCSRSKERLTLLKQDGEVTSLAFNPKGSLLFGHSNGGEVTVWDMNMGRVKHKWVDEGCIQGSTLAVSSSNQFIAAGSEQGVVNLYGVEDVLMHKLPKPRKTIFNITTSITDLKFNPTSEILSFTSNLVENSVRLLHLASGTVFNNFPTFGTKMGNINVVNFSPGSGYAAFGNKKGTVSLYRLKHFKNY